MSAAPLRRLAGIGIGAAVLWLADRVLDPVPVAAGTAYLLGAVLLAWKGWQGFFRIMAVAGVGAIAGIYIHAHWHLSGQSPAPAEGLPLHLAWEGLIGLAAAMLALIVARTVLKPGVAEGNR